MKIYLYCVILYLVLLPINPTNAQVNRTIALGNSTNFAPEISNGDVSMFESAALTGIRESDLCLVLERKEWEKILKEKGIQKTEEFLNGKIVEQNMALGAEFLLIITIQNMDITENKTQYNYTNILTKNQEQGWTREIKCNVILGAKVVSIADGVVKYNKTFTLSKTDSSKDKNGYFATSRTDIAAAMKPDLAEQCKKSFRNFMYEVFPPAIEIIKIEAQTQGKKEKAEQVLCKTTSELVEGSNLEVYTEEILSVGGETMVRKKNVAMLKVLRMEGGSIALCKVTTGGESILQLMNGKTSLKCDLISSGNGAQQGSGITLPKINLNSLNNLIKN